MKWSASFHTGTLVKCLLLTVMISTRTSLMSSIHLPTGNYTQRDVYFGKYFKAVNQFGKRVLHIVFLVIYSTLETTHGSLPVEDYCLQNLMWTNTQYRSVFTATERDVLRHDPKSPQFTCDITLLFKLISKILGNLAEPFIQEIRDLKNLRNTVCHEDMKMNKADLQTKVTALENLCCKIIDELGAVTGEDVNSFLQEMKDGLQDLLLAKTEASDLKTYLEDIDSFREQKHSKFMIEGRRELIDVYAKVKILNPCSWLSDNQFSEFSVDKIFTSLVVLSDGGLIEINNILDVKAMKTRFVPRLIIISGVMGVGKTSLYRHVLDEWSKRSPKISGLSSMDIVIGIELKNVSCGSLVQLLREQLLQSTSRLFNETDIIPLLQEMNVLFALDGMDEANINGKMIVREIIKKFPNSRIIITTRPAFMLELMKMAEDHVVFQINGFDEQGKLKFISNVFAAKYCAELQRESETKKFLHYLSSTCESISSHLTIPLILALLLVLWNDEAVDVTSITTLTRLYHKIYDMCKRKLASRLEATGAGHSESLIRKIHRWLVKLGSVAWKMLHNDVLQITEENSTFLMDICENEGIDPIQTMSAFLNCEVTENIVGTNYKFSFYHCSGIDFLAAVYIDDQIAKNESTFDIFSAIDSPRYRDLMMYVTGLLKINGHLTSTLASQIKYSFIVDMGVLPSDSNTWWKLLQEAEKDHSVSMVLGSIINQTDVWIINSQNSKETTEAKLNLLRETCASPIEIIMQVHYTTTLSCCKELQDILHWACEGQSKVKLYLEKEFNSVGQEEYSDKHVVPLLKSNRIVEFKGHAGEAFMAELARATRIRSIFTRVSSIKALYGLQASIRKYRQCKLPFLPSKWSLNDIELFLDFSKDTIPQDVPKLQYGQTLTVKFTDVTDHTAVWAGKVLKHLNHQYSSIIFLSSNITDKGMRELLDATSNAKIKVIRVLSNYSPTPKEINLIGKKYKVRIGWGCA